MRLLDKARLRLRSLLRRDSVESELDAELRFHLDQLIKENIASGMQPGDARWAALRAIGGITQFQEECRDTRRVGLIENLAQDIRYGIRTLRKTPAFTGVVVATLALGIGGITAVFSVVEAVLLAPLPYETPGQLVRLYQQESNDPSTRHYLSGAHFREIRDNASSFEQVAALFTYSETGLDLNHGEQAQRLRVLEVTSGYFDVLRPGPLRGRAFAREEETGARLVILSDSLWRSRFHADPAVIGQTVRLSAEPYVITGVAPEGFHDPIVGRVDVWLPYDLASNTSEHNYSLTAIGRLRSQAALTQAETELSSLGQALAERWPDVRLDAFAVQPLKEDLVAHSRPTLSLLSIAVALVLLVACLNVANLFLVRATGRASEFAIRAALGSGGVRIARQLLVESVLLATAGGAAGLALGAATLEGLRALGGNTFPRLSEVGLDPMVLGVTAAVTLATGLAFGMMPAFRFARIHPSQVLHRQSRSATGDRGQVRLRNALAVVQVAFALMLLAGAGILTASFYRLQSIDLGFQTDGVLTFELSLPAARYDGAHRAAFQEELASRIETIPGVTAAGGSSRLPATGPFHPWPTQTLTGPNAGQDFRLRTQQRIVSGDFLETLAIPLLAGRVFDARDDASAPAVAVVSRTVAQQAFPGMPFEEVLGHRIRIFSWERQIIGVVGDVSLDARGTPFPTVYHAHRQFAENRNWVLTQVVAGALPPEQILADVRVQVADLDPQLVVYRAAPLAEVVGRGVSRERFALILMGAFAVVGITLAAIGLCGVLAYSARQRMQEFGIRIALGATAGDVRRLVLRQAAGIVAIGITVGIGGSLAVGRWLSSLLYETDPQDASVLAATALLLIVVAFVSAWLPAWRASRVEPRIAIQEE